MTDAPDGALTRAAMQWLNELGPKLKAIGLEHPGAILIIAVPEPGGLRHVVLHAGMPASAVEGLLQLSLRRGHDPG